MLSVSGITAEEYVLTFMLHYYTMFSSERYIAKGQRNAMNIQYKKGVLELCVLSLISEQDRYGYDVSESLSRYIDISDGTVYPILRKLKNDGLVTTYLVEESGGPPRKYYKLSERGRAEFEAAKSEWLNFVKVVAKLLEGENAQ